VDDRAGRALEPWAGRTKPAIRALRATIFLGIAIGLAAHADADELGRDRPPVRLELGPCLEHVRDAIQRAVRVEVGEDAAASGARSVQVRVDCAPDGLDAGVVLEVTPPDNPRRYRYALDWRAQPLDARPRLIGLAVAEAVDASQIELIALPERTAPAVGSSGAPASARAASDWALALVGTQRSFFTDGGVGMMGAGLSPTRRLSARLRLAADVLLEGTTVVTSSGAIIVRSLSSAPHLVARAGGRVHGEIGLGVRAGIVRMHGEALPQSRLVGRGLVRGWLGPIVSIALGADLTRAVAVTASVELGITASGATGRDGDETVAALGGAWASFCLATAIAL